MLSKLTRIALAFVTALAFSGQLQAASAHCARLAAAQAEVVAVAETPDCHGMTDAEAKDRGGEHHAAPSPAPAHPQQPVDHCECLAALKVFVELAAPRSAQRIEPYAWMRQDAATFASVEPSPALKPPRA